MALLGWVPATGAAEPAGHLADTEQPRFVHNASGRFESRWSMVRRSGKTRVCQLLEGGNRGNHAQLCVSLRCGAMPGACSGLAPGC